MKAFPFHVAGRCRFASPLLALAAVLILAASPVGAALPLSTSPSQNLSVSGAQGAVWGDANGDGYLDVLLIKSTSKCPLLRNNPVTNTFTEVWTGGNNVPPQATPPPPPNVAAAFGDLNRDRKLDLVIALQTAILVYIHRQQGPADYNLTFNKSITPTGAGSIVDIALGDLDNNGELDLVVARNGGTLQVHYNWRNGQFSSLIETAQTRTAASVAVGDINKDSYPDIFLGQQGAGKNQVFYTDSQSKTIPVSHSFEFQHAGATSTTSLDSALGDVDGDGDLDIVCANYANPVSVYVNLGGTPPTYNQFNSGDQQTQTVALGDVNGDGLLEAVFGYRLGSAPIRIFEWDSTLGNLKNVASWSSTSNLDAKAVTFADYTGNNKLDLLAVKLDDVLAFNDTYPLYPVDSSGSVAVLSRTTDIHFGYFNNDDVPDLFAANRSQKDQVFYSTNSSSPWESGPTLQSTHAAVKDIDNNGFPDVAVAAGDNNAVFYYNTGGTLSTSPDWYAMASPGSNNAVAMGDVDKDLAEEIVLGYANAPLALYDTTVDAVSRAVRIGRTPLWRSNNSYITKALLMADVDSDGEQDLVVGNYGQPNAFFIREGNAFQAGPVLQTANSRHAQCIAAGDVSGDGYLDIAFGNNGEPVTLFLNTGQVLPGAYNVTPDWLSANTYDVRGIALQDVNYDGWPDLICTVNNGADLIFFNRGGTLDTQPGWQDTLTGSKTGVDFADIDGDGDLDMALGIDNGPKMLFHSGYRPTKFFLPNNEPVAQFTSRIKTVQASKVVFKYMLWDQERDRCFIRPQFSINNGGSWQDAREYAQFGSSISEGIADLNASPSGIEHTFIWDLDAERVLGKPVNNDFVIFRILVFSWPRHYGLMTRGAYVIQTPSFQCKAAPEVNFFLPEENGTSNNNISLHYSLSEPVPPTSPLISDQSRVRFSFHGLNGCADQVVTKYLNSGNILDLPGRALPAENNIVVLGDDLSANGNVTTNDRLANGCLYDVTLEVTDSAGNIYQKTHSNWLFDVNDSIITDIRVCDNAPVENQEQDALCRVTNDRLVNVFVTFTGNPVKFWYTQVGGIWDPSNSFPINSNTCPNNQCQFSVTLQSPGASGCFNEPFYGRLETAAGTFSGVEDTNILMDIRYDTNTALQPLEVQFGSGGEFQAARDLNATWSGGLDNCSGTHGYYFRSTVLKGVFGGPWLNDQWTLDTRLALKNLPLGWVDFHMAPQDRAGNRPQVRPGETKWEDVQICIDLDAPTFPVNSRPIVDGNPNASYTNKKPIEITWAAASDIGCSGLAVYRLIVKDPATQTIYVDQFPTDPTFSWTNPPLEKRVDIIITAYDWAGNGSDEIRGVVNVDRVPPKIFMAGYVYDIYSHQCNGNFYMLAYTPEQPDVASVQAYTLLNPDSPDFRMTPLGAYLEDLGSLTTPFGLCGFSRGDGLWGLCAKLPDGIPGLCALLGLRAVDHAGNGSSLWPFLNVCDSCIPSPLPPGANGKEAPPEIPEIDLAEIFTFDTFDEDIKHSLFPENERLELQKGVDIIRQSLSSIIVPGREERSAENNDQGPSILIAGFMNSDISCPRGGNLHFCAVVTDPRYSSNSTDLFLTLFQSGSNQPCAGLRDGATIRSDNPSFCLGPVPLAPGDLDIGPYTAVDYNTYPVGECNKVGGYGIAVQARAPESQRSNLWPFLSVTTLPFTLDCSFEPLDKHAALDVPATFKWFLDGGRTNGTCDLNDGKVQYKRLEINPGDGTQTQVFTPVDPIGEWEHTYTHEGTYTAQLTARDIDDRVAVCLVQDINVSLCFGDPTKIRCFPTYESVKLEPKGCRVTFHANVRCNPAQLVEWEFDDGTTGTGENVTHDFTEDGIHWARLRAVNANDPGDEFRDFIPVLENCGGGPPIITACNIHPIRRECRQPFPIMVFANPISSGGVAPFDIRVHWGDGQIDDWAALGSRSHSYTQPGAYTIVIDIRDSGLPPYVPPRTSLAQCVQEIYLAPTETDSLCSNLLPSPDCVPSVRPDGCTRPWFCYDATVYGPINEFGHVVRMEAYFPDPPNGTNQYCQFEEQQVPINPDNTFIQLGFCADDFCPWNVGDTVYMRVYWDGIRAGDYSVVIQ